jgi:hypothetical protein
MGKNRRRRLRAHNGITGSYFESEGPLENSRPLSPLACVVALPDKSPLTSPKNGNCHKVKGSIGAQPARPDAEPNARTRRTQPRAGTPRSRPRKTPREITVQRFTCLVTAFTRTYWRDVRSLLTLSVQWIIFPVLCRVLSPVSDCIGGRRSVPRWRTGYGFKEVPRLLGNIADAGVRGCGEG